MVAVSAVAAAAELWVIYKKATLLTLYSVFYLLNSYKGIH